MNEFDKRVEALLRAWASEQGGEQMRRFGRCAFDKLRSPAANDPDGGDPSAIERHVRRMEALGRWKEARVLRTEYLMPFAPEAERIAALNRLGIDISRTTYYVYLSSARTFIVGAMSANDDPLDDASDIA